MFVPYRTCGLVCAGSQQHLQTLGSETFFTTSVGRAFHVWKADHLGLSMVSAQLPRAITHVVASRDTTFAATEGGGIVVHRRGRPYLELGAPALPPVVSLLPLQGVLLSLHADGALCVWDAAAAAAAFSGAPSDGIAAALPAAAPPAYLLARHALPAALGRPTALLHPDTYVNKVAVGTDRGVVAIVNFRTGRVVHECTVLPPGAAVTALAQSPAADVVAAGGSEGSVVLHNLRAAERLPGGAFSHAGGAGGVTALAFSAGNTLAAPLLASATEGGALALWDLGARSLRATLPAAHDGAVTHLAWLPGQPVLLSGGGGDNSVREWAVDRLDGTPRPLRARAGHTAPPRIIRYFAGGGAGGGPGATGTLGSGADAAAACEIVSAGADRTLRLFHTALDRQNRELSQGRGLAAGAAARGVGEVRLPPIVALAGCDRRSGQWADVVTAHAGSSRVACWRWDRKALDERALAMPDAAESVTAVAISACGSFALVGGAGGTVCAFNLQSGARRGTFPHDARVRSAVDGKGARRSQPWEGGLGGELGGEAPAIPFGARRGKGQGRLGGIAADSIDAALASAAGIQPPPRVTERYRAPGWEGGGGGGGGGSSPLPARHTSAVHGVGSDALNSTVFSCDGAGLLLFWDFSTHAPLGGVALPSPATALVAQRDAGLLALPCDDFAVRVVDVGSRALVRTFRGHTNRVTDVAFSPDGRWLLSAAMDGAVRTWDLPSGRCVDWMAFPAPCVSLALAPNGEYLATAHAGSLGVSLWANRAHFGAVVAEEARVPREPLLCEVPAAGGGEEESDGEVGDGVRAATIAADTAPEDGAGKSGRKRSRGSSWCCAPPPPPPPPAFPPAHLLGCSITLSGLPTAAWDTLSKLDAIAARNAPLQPAQKPVEAPFFLPTTGGLSPTFVKPQEAAAAAAGGGSRVGRRSAGGAALEVAPPSRLCALLAQAPPHAAVAALLATLPPAGVEVELRSLCRPGGGGASLRAMLGCLARWLQDGTAFDLATAYAQLTLSLHAEELRGEECAEALAELARAQGGGAAKLNGLIDGALGRVNFFLGT
jgi:U3 small nucleolar RNA-associated protein 21